MRQNEAQPGVPESKGIGIEKPILSATFDTWYDVFENEAQPGDVHKPIRAVKFDPRHDVRQNEAQPGDTPK